MSGPTLAYQLRVEKRGNIELSTGFARRQTEDFDESGSKSLRLLPEPRYEGEP